MTHSIQSKEEERYYSSYKKGLIESMKTEFYDSANFKPEQAELSLSAVSNNSAEKSSCQFSSATNLEKLNCEHQMRSCIEQKASQGNYAVAIALLDQLITLRPNNATDYNNRGLMYFRNNQIPVTS